MMGPPAMRTNVFAVAAIGLAIASGPSCRRDERPPVPAASGRPFTVGVLQSVDSPTASELRRGLRRAFAEAGLVEGRDIVVALRIADNDIAEVQRLARELAGGGADLIVPLSTQALQAAILSTRSVPIVFGAVAVPYLVGAGRSAADHLPNVTGVVSTGPVRETVSLIREVLPSARRIGSLWTPAEINSEYYLEQARAAALALGFDLIAVPVDGPAAIQPALRRLLNGRVQALLPMSDNTLNSSFDIVGRAADEAGVPLFASFLRSVEFGACAALGFDFAEMGLETGRLVVRVKNGESPGRIPIRSLAEVRLYLNSAAAAKQGVVFPTSVLGRASRTVALTPAGEGVPAPVLD